MMIDAPPAYLIVSFLCRISHQAEIMWEDVHCSLRQMEVKSWNQTHVTNVTSCPQDNRFTGQNRAVVTQLGKLVQ